MFEATGEESTVTTLSRASYQTLIQVESADHGKITRRNSNPNAKHLLFFPIAVVCAALLLLPGNVHAGTGTFTDGKFNFCVSVRFNATDAQLQLIRKAFEDGSQILADATDGQHRFGTVNIVNNDTSSAEQAEFWILPNAGQTTATFGRFGKKGQHVLYFFSPDFTSPEPNFAPEPFWATRRAYTIAHEFAHHAYDLLDEYKNRNGQSGPTISCPPIPADGCNPNLNYCLMDRPSDRGGAGCPTTSRIHTMNEFCVASNHDKANASGDGNGETAQSVFRHRSCWETIARLNKPWKLSAPGLPTSASPSFQPVTFGTSCGIPKVAIVIDRSGSMTTDNRLSFAKLGAEQFINTYSGGSLAVVSFSNSASVNFTLTEINDEFSRNNAKAAVNALVAGGATNIGDGLLAALGQLNSQGDCSSCEKTIILLSDGEHNVGTPPESVVSQLNNNGVKLLTSVVGSSISAVGEAALQNITTETNGEFYRVSTASDATGQSIPGYGSSGLVGLFMRWGSDMKGDAMLKQHQQLLTSGQVKEFPILVETRAVNVTFAATIADQSDNMTLTLRSPSGVLYTGSSGPTVEFTSSSNAKIFRVNAPESGTWTMVTSAGSINTGKVEILSFAKHDGVRLDAWVEHQSVTATEKTQIYATPTFEGERVVGASVTGVVGRPDGSRISLTLFDDGLDSNGDVEANDGVYSALFDSYTTNGTYVFELTTQNSTGRAYAGESLSTDAPSNDKPLPPFIRSANTTAIVSGLTLGETIWFDDALPEGATAHGAEDLDWYWVDANPGAFSGSKSHQSRSFGQLAPPNSFHQHYFDGATTTLPVSVGDKLFTYVFLDINNMPREIMLQWHDGVNWEHRAYWGLNEINFGTDGTNSRRYMGPLPKAGQWVRLEVPANLVGLEGSTLNGMAFTLGAGRATWDLAGKVSANAPPPPTTAPGDFVWIEDGLPAGAVPSVVDDQWNWVTNLHFSGQRSHQTRFDGGEDKQFRSHSFTGAQATMQINPGDVLFTYVYLGDADSSWPPYNGPDQIMLQWYDGTSWEHRAFWGVNFIGARISNIGVQGTEGQRYMGGLPATRGWYRLEVPASYVGLEGKSVSGMAFSAYRNQSNPFVAWDRSGKSPTLTSVPLTLSSKTGVWQSFSNVHGYAYETLDVPPTEHLLQKISFFAHANQAAGTVPMHRFRRPSTYEYFYTTCKPCVGNDWQYEGIAFYVYPDASTPGTVPLYLYHDNRSKYFLTINQNEAAGMTFDAIWAYVFPVNDLVSSPPTHLHYDGSVMRWKDNSGTETGFKVERFDYPGPWKEVAVLPANSTSWGKIGQNAPSFRVRATNSFGDSAYSNIACGCFEDWVDSPNTSPEVYISSPVNGDAVARDFTIAVNVFDNNGAATVAKVELYGDGIKLGESIDAPYMFVWNNASSGQHTLTAVATDSAGASKTSAPVTITVSDSPLVSITAPASGSVFTALTTIQIQASASDGDGSISKVEFFQGQVKIGEDTTAPYAFSWTNVQAGNYQLAAKAIDNNGLSASSTFVPVTVNGPPTVGITSPASGLIVDAPANLTIAASALDNDGTISKVEFYQGTTLLGTDTTSPYSVQWNGVGYGVYSLTAKATDNRGAITSSAAITVTVNSLPTVNITSPTNGLVVDGPANLTISASALDSDGTVSKVEFYRGTVLIGTDTTSPYAIAWNGVGSGVYSLTAKATDNRGSIMTSAAVTVTVNSPPTISITSPTNGVVVDAPANFTISANALDSDGTVNKVDFYQGTTLIGTDTSSPYSITWNNVGYGVYSLTAKATDNRASLTSSPAVSVTVNNPPGSNQIMFASNREGSSQLYSMNSDGTDPIRRTEHSANDECPRWSPNNTRVVFQSDRINPFSGLADIYVMNPDGGGQTRLTTDPADDSAPVWSPDGTKIAFQSARNGTNYQVYVMNADGSGQMNISNTTSNDGQPSWSPDGTKIAFTSDRDHPGKASIYVMNANGSNQTRLTLSGIDVTDDQPMWSPDGTRIAFVSTRDSILETWQETDDNGEVLIRTRLHINKEVYVMNADGTNQVRLTNTLENDDSPVWSRDGTKILFRSDRERECCDPVAQIWVMNADGSNQVNVSNSSYGNFGGSW